MDTIDIFIYGAYTLIILATVSAILLPLINAVSNPSSLVKGFVSIAALGILFVLAYVLASSEVTPIYAKFSVGPELSKMVGGMIGLSYLLLLGAVVGIFLTEIRKAIS
ncbi:MAG: hypothetical protein ACFCUU_02625 [Cyclobacteriaceae bacterium]